MCIAIAIFQIILDLINKSHQRGLRTTDGPFEYAKLVVVPVGGSTLSTKMKMAFSALSLILLRMTYTNCPTVRSAGTRYLKNIPSK